MSANVRYADIPFALLNVHYSLNSDQKSRLRDS